MRMTIKYAFLIISVYKIVDNFKLVFQGRNNKVFMSDVLKIRIIYQQYASL